MIRSLGYDRNYGWWQFSVNKSDVQWATIMVSSILKSGLRRMIRREEDPVAYYGHMRGRIKGYARIEDMYAKAWAAHVMNPDPMSVHPILWSQSKTGIVNITEFKDKFKEAIARFLAGAVTLNGR